MSCINNSEDDTFEALKRAPFMQVFNDWVKTEIPLRTLLHKHNWEYDEFVLEVQRHDRSKNLVI